MTVTQPVKLTRDVTTDKVTKVPSYGEWTNGQWDEKDTPVITGYTPSESSVGQVLVNGDSQDTTINISYTANDQKAVVKIFDKKIGKDIYLENLLGTTDGKISFKNADDQLAVFLTKGYALADGNSDLTDGQFTPSKFDNVDNVDQVFTAILVHTYSKDSEKKTVTRTINYHKPDGKIDTVTQPVELTRDVTIDKVNQSKTFGDWTSSQWGEKTTPKIAGYTASLDSVGQVTVDGLTKDQVVDIGYKANDQKAVVKIYDDKTKQLLKQFDLSGATAEAINFAEADQQLAGYLAKGYALADSGNDDLAGGKFIAADYDNVDAVDQEFAAYLVHTYAKSNETKTITRTINYHLPSGTEAVEQTAELTRPVTTDLVTGATSYGDWTRSEFTSQKTPELSNYTPSTSLITNREVTHGDADSQENVYYYPNKQKATISFVDSKTGKTIKLMADFDSGKPNEAINFTQAKAQLATLLKEGYKETGDLESIWKAVFAGTDGENNFVIRLVPSLDMHPSVAPGKQSTKPKTTKKGKEAGQKPSVPATGQAGQKPGLTGQTAGKGQQAASPAGQTAKTQSAKLPQTGEASGKQLSWLGLLLAAVGTALSGIWRKKRDDE